MLNQLYEEKSNYFVSRLFIFWFNDTQIWFNVCSLRRIRYAKKTQIVSFFVRVLISFVYVNLHCIKKTLYHNFRCVRIWVEWDMSQFMFWLPIFVPFTRRYIEHIFKWINFCQKQVEIRFFNNFLKGFSKVFAGTVLCNLAWVLIIW